jgi:hypothetical protein
MLQVNEAGLAAEAFSIRSDGRVHRPPHSQGHWGSFPLAAGAASPGKIETHMTIDEALQMVFGNLIFSAEAIEQQLRAGDPNDTTNLVDGCCACAAPVGCVGFGLRCSKLSVAPAAIQELYRMVLSSWPRPRAA